MAGGSEGHLVNARLVDKLGKFLSFRQQKLSLGD